MSETTSTQENPSGISSQQTNESPNSLPSQEQAPPALEVPFETPIEVSKPVIPEDEATETPSVEVDPVTEGSPPPEATVYTPEQVTHLASKAATLDIIENDPEAVALITKLFKSRETGDDPSAIPTELPATEGSDMKELNKRLDGMQTLIQQLHANNEVRDFKQTHPDFEDHKVGMATILKAHPSMNLETAYNYEKMSKAQSSQGGSPSKVRLQTPEGSQRGPTTSNEQPTLADIEKKIRDPEATKSTGDAVRLAWDAAKAHEQARTE